MNFFALVRSEWIKFRSVRSTLTGLVVFAALTIGIGVLVSSAIRSHWDRLDPVRKLVFDPVSTSLGGTLFAQFAVGALGVLMVTSEFASGSIRTTLAAVPHRARLVLAKAVVLVASLLVASEAVVFSAFSIGQSIFRGNPDIPTASLSISTDLRAVVLAGAYLTLLGLFGMGLGLILRSTASSIITYTVLLLIVPLVLLALPTSWQNDVNRFLPANLGSSMMATSTPANSFSWTSATLVLALYAVGVTLVGWVLLARRDA